MPKSMITSVTVPNFLVNLSRVNNQTSLKFLQESLSNIMFEIEVQQDNLKAKRARQIQAHEDKKHLLKCLNYCRHLPQFPYITASECRKLADLFYVDKSLLWAWLERKQTSAIKDIAINRRRAVVKMYMKGIKQVKIAANLGLSRGRVSQIVREHKKSLNQIVT